MLRRFLRWLVGPSVVVQKVEIVVSSDSDPSRVARLVLAEFQKLAAKHPGKGAPLPTN